nr:glycosyltransferase [Candidatus Kapabacteria bacterium]
MFTLLVISTTIYAARLAFFLIGQARPTPQRVVSTEVPFVSVIVPARNEEANLERCLTALSASDYPADRFEIIVVNDRSDDATEQVLEDLAAKLPKVRPLHRRDTLDHPNLKGKPGALQHGIDHATGSVYVLTDADCLVHREWLRTMVAPFADETVSLVCGFTVIR